MTVFFTTSLRGRVKFSQEFDYVYQVVSNFKSIKLISPYWKDNYQPFVRAAKKRKISNSRLLEYNAMRQAIRYSDAVIIEASHESFQLGVEAHFALTEKKPVLCLSLKEDFGSRIQNDYFFGKKYTKKNLRPIIQDFLAHVRDINLSRRFNMFLYPHQIKHLHQQAKQNKMNLSEYIRHLINIDRLNHVQQD